MRRSLFAILAIGVCLLATLATSAFATKSGVTYGSDFKYAPGPNGSCRVVQSGTSYVFQMHRNSSGQLIRRVVGRNGAYNWTTIPHTSTTDYPAVATNGGGRIWCVHTGAGSLWAAYSDDRGVTWKYNGQTCNGWGSWHQVDSQVYGAPTIVAGCGGFTVCYRRTNGGYIYAAYVSGSSNTMITFGVPSFSVSTRSAPLLVNTRGSILCIYRDTSNRMMYYINADDYNAPWYGPYPLSYGVSGNHSEDPPMTQYWGSVVNGKSGTGYGHWTYHQQEVEKQDAHVMKYVLRYDDQGNNFFAVQRQQITDALNRGVKVIVFRTADTSIQVPALDRLMGDYVWEDKQSEFLTTSMWKWNRDYGAQFIIEVGNEPDVHAYWGTRASAFRTRLLDAIDYLKTNHNYPYVLYHAAAISCETSKLSYYDTLTSPDPNRNNRKIQDEYDGLAVHTYGFNNLYESDGKTPWCTLERALGVLPIGKDIGITEVGVNNYDPWGTKAQYTIDFLYALPKEVRYITTFCQDTSVKWNNDDYKYGVDTVYGSPPDYIYSYPYATKMGNDL